MNHIWIIEDEKAISDVVKAYLVKEGHMVSQFFNGLEAMKGLDSPLPDLVILDIHLPFFDGDHILKALRSKSDVPVIMLTSKADEDSRIQSLTLGADDYVTKPFSTPELVLRVKRILYRTYGSQEKVMITESLLLDSLMQEVTLNGKPLDLTANEIRVLDLLVKHKGRVFTREQIIEQAFGYDYQATPRNIDTYIKNIRHKIEKDPKSPQIILTKYGLGYYYGGGRET